MSNTIIKRQNSDTNIARLAAQRQIYRDDGNIETVNAVLSVIMPLGFAVIQEIMTEWTWAQTSSCCLSIAMLVVSQVLSSACKNQKELAASIQQEFDVDVYQMPWDDKLFGARKNLNDEIGLIAGSSRFVPRYSLVPSSRVISMTRILRSFVPSAGLPLRVKRVSPRHFLEMFIDSLRRITQRWPCSAQ